ncbi:MAG: acyl-CoA dehydrogenase family protein [Solirubrobacteraceae bacterium]
MDFELTDEQQLIKSTAREFADKEIVPVAGENSRNHHFDTDLVAKIAAQGYLGAIVPREYGGAGLDYITYALICEEIGRGCSAMRTVISVQTSLVCSTILKWGTEEQKQKYLPKLCSGEWLGCFGLTEPDTGSDAANQRTRAVRQDDGSWKINGAKMWISLGNHASLALVFAQTDPELKHRGLACFLVETEGQDGFQPQEIKGKMGLWASDTAQIGLDDVIAPADSMLGEVGDGFKVAMSALDSGRYSVAAGCVGICQASVEESTKYAKERHAFQRPIASFQLVQDMIAEMVVKTDAARLLVYRAGALKDKGVPSTTEISIAKFYATEAACWCADRAIQVHGGSGYADDFPVERYYRDARVTTLYEGTSQIQKLIIGRATTGINALIPS